MEAVSTSLLVLKQLFISETLFILDYFTDRGKTLALKDATLTD